MFRLGTWNLNWASSDRAERAGKLLADLGGADLILFQEAHPKGLPVFCKAAGLGWFRSTYVEFPALIEARGRASGRGVAIAGRLEPPQTVHGLEGLPFVEKVLVASVPLGGSDITFASYHAPAGRTHLEKKPLQAVRFAEWLQAVEGPAIFGGDFNTPETDHPEPRRVRTHWHSGDPRLNGEPGDDLLVGSEPIHGLRDAYREWLNAHQGIREQIVAERPNGPLAVTYRTGRIDASPGKPGRPGNPRRYDAIWLTKHFDVETVRHLYDESYDAGIDHALVLAELTVVDPSG